MRRARYRRAELRRISPVELRAETAGADEAVRWIPDVSLDGSTHAALLIAPGARVSYEVNLPARARVGAWCAITARDAERHLSSVEFEIVVRTGRSESSARRIVQPGKSSVEGGWHLLRLDVIGSGPATIVLTTKATGESELDGVNALWGDPYLDTPRPIGDLVSVARATMSRRSARAAWHRALPPDTGRLYATWTEQNEPSGRELEVQRQSSAGATRCFSLLTIVTDPSHRLSKHTAASVLGQTYPAWEWILMIPEGSPRDTGDYSGIARDARVRIVTFADGTSRPAALNSALRSARGEFAAFLDPHDVLSPSALYEVAGALERQPECDVLYSDEDQIEDDGRDRHAPCFKPDWSPDFLLSENYIGRLAAMRIAKVVAAGGLRDGFGAADEWELWLRLSRSGTHFRRLPRCLYHRRQPTDTLRKEDADSVVRDHCEAIGWPTAVIRPLVSVVIPNRNASAVLTQCVTGLLERTDYPQIELILVDNGSTEVDVLELYHAIEQDGRGRIVPFDRPFNFSAACNAGAAVASGELLLFLNNDVEVIDPAWLDELVRWAQRPEIGIVGAKLLYPDRLIQHAGVVFGLGLVGHIFARASEGLSTVFGSTESYRNYTAVTGACQLMRRDVFQKLGGYDERFRLSFSDVVLCMEAWRAGYRVVYTPHARLVHHESFTRARQDSQDDVAMLARYLQVSRFVDDPYFHPELDPKSPIPAVRPAFEPSPRQVVADSVNRAIAAARAFTA